MYSTLSICYTRTEYVYLLGLKPGAREVSPLRGCELHLAITRTASKAGAGGVSPLARLADTFRRLLGRTLQPVTLVTPVIEEALRIAGVAPNRALDNHLPLDSCGVTFQNTYITLRYSV